MKLKLLGAAIAAAWLCASQASATTYNYTVGFDIGAGNHVTGSIATDCNNCLLHDSDFVSWAFSLNGNFSFSSTNAGAQIFEVDAGSPLTATPTEIFYSPATPFANFVFQAPGSAPGNIITLGFQNVGGNFISYITDNSSADGVFLQGPPTTVIAEISATPLPATLPLFAAGLGALGLLGWRRKRKAAALVLVLTLFGIGFSAQIAQANIVQNPGFETGNFFGWTSGNWNPTTSGPGGTVPYDGNFFAVSLGTGAPLLQTFATVAGTTYDLSFAFNHGPAGGGVDVIWNGALITVINPGPAGWAVYDFSVLASANSTTLEFITFNSGFSGIDDVSVEPTPLPAALPLFASGAGLLGFLGWRRKRKAAALAA